ncbi:MAG: amino acid ABC transporter permease [Actinomycetota bacterium]|nr:amino acid ABC transporter permease [Actinomycetota bacterium]
MNSSVLFDAPGPKARRRHLILGIVGSALLLVLLALAALRLNDKGQFDAYKWRPFLTSSLWKNYLLPGLVGTLKAAAIAIVISCVLGAVLAMLRLIEPPAKQSPVAVLLRAVKVVAGAWVEVTRAIPVLLMMLFIFGLLSAQGWIDSGTRPLVATVSGLVFYNSAVICEVIRSGVDQLPGGQREAGLAIGLPAGQTVRTILLPQAVTTMLPALIGQLVVVLKDTALGYTVFYGELLNRSKPATAANGNIFAMLVVVAAIYILLNYGIGKLAELVERRMKRRGRSAGAAPGLGGGSGVVAGPSSAGPAGFAAPSVGS